MFETPQVMRYAQLMARHAGATQNQVARNMANADTPGFRGKTLASFADAVARPDRSGLAMKVTHAAHLPGLRTDTFRAIETGDPVDASGNNVSLEGEMMRAASAQSQHTTAMTVYKSSLDLMRTALGRGR